MVNLTKLNDKRKEIIIGFSEEELINYIQQLTEKYYISFFNNDYEVYSNTVDYLKEVILLFKGKYPQLNQYINFCLVRSINKILNENVASGIELVLIEEEQDQDFISNQPFDDLITALECSKKTYLEQKELEERVEVLENENFLLKQEL